MSLSRLGLDWPWRRTTKLQFQYSTRMRSASCCPMGSSRCGRDSFRRQCTICIEELDPGNEETRDLRLGRKDSRCSAASSVEQAVDG